MINFAEIRALLKFTVSPQTVQIRSLKRPQASGLLIAINRDLTDCRSGSLQAAGSRRIDIEYIDNDENGNEFYRPRVLIENIKNTDILRTAIWRGINEDYDETVTLNRKYWMYKRCLTIYPENI